MRRSEDDADREQRLSKQIAYKGASERFNFPVGILTKVVEGHSSSLGLLTYEYHARTRRPCD
jgi:hypothetical protein